MLSPEAANIAKGVKVMFTFIFGNHFSREEKRYVEGN
jgi:hypothetical protein